MSCLKLQSEGWVQASAVHRPLSAVQAASLKLWCCSKGRVCSEHLSDRTLGLQVQPLSHLLMASRLLEPTAAQKTQQAGPASACGPLWARSPEPLTFPIEPASAKTSHSLPSLPALPPLYLEVLVLLREALVGQDLVDSDAFATHSSQACEGQRVTGNLRGLPGCPI